MKGRRKLQEVPYYIPGSYETLKKCYLDQKLSLPDAPDLKDSLFELNPEQAIGITVTIIFLLILQIS